MKTLFDHLCLQRVMVVVQEPRDNEIRGVVPSFQVRSPALTSDVCLLKVGDLVNVTCYSRGSSPPAQLQWSVNGERVSKAELLMDILSIHTEDSAQFTFSTFRSSLTHAALPTVCTACGGVPWLELRIISDLANHEWFVTMYFCHVSRCKHNASCITNCRP